MMVLAQEQRVVDFDMVHDRYSNKAAQLVPDLLHSFTNKKLFMAKSTEAGALSNLLERLMQSAVLHVGMNSTGKERKSPVRDNKTDELLTISAYILLAFEIYKFPMA
ncbi:hypothetical protein DUI87_10997 [Hirundo rustica rustica]|uniref:Uncharacterized protein n=1 Tax=Hirundo rustica rustica TaxID=333673 RepID=A0A3M0KJM6_HIRRU|nr:hypothetical protein DUI87_10997 [Hirundo rustica rustica]